MSIRDDYENEIDDLKQQVKRLTKQLKNGQRPLVETTKHYLDEAYDGLNEQWDTAKHKVKDAGRQAEHYAKENPWKAAGIAAATGFLAAMLMGGARRRD